MPYSQSRMIGLGPGGDHAGCVATHPAFLDRQDDHHAGCRASSGSKTYEEAFSSPGNASALTNAPSLAASS